VAPTIFMLNKNPVAPTIFMLNVTPTIFMLDYVAPTIFMLVTPHKPPKPVTLPTNRPNLWRPKPPKPVAPTCAC